MGSKILRPGTPAPKSAQYEITNRNGVGTGVERQSTRNHPLPPTPKPGQGYRVVDPAKNGAGAGKGGRR